jgi:hypothetical protein
MISTSSSAAWARGSPCFGRRIKQVLHDVILDYLGDEPVQRPPAGGRLLQDRRAIFLLLDWSSLDGVPSLASLSVV